MAQARRSNTQLRILQRARKPTKNALCFMLMCVLVIIFNNYLVNPSFAESDFTIHMDNATAYFAKSLCYSLILTGYIIAGALSYRWLLPRLLCTRNHGRLKLLTVRGLMALCFCVIFMNVLVYTTVAAQSYVLYFFHQYSLLGQLYVGGQSTSTVQHSDLHSFRSDSGPYLQIDPTVPVWHISSIETHRRYLSEDVKFLCKLQLPTTLDDVRIANISYRIWWTLHNRNVSGKTKMDTERISLHDIRSTLLVPRIAHQDYGTYKCLIALRFGQAKLEENQLEAATFHLEPQHFGHHDLIALPGTSFSVLIDPFIVTHEDAELSVTHIVKNPGDTEFKIRKEHNFVDAMCKEITLSNKYGITRYRQRLEEEPELLKIYRDPDLDTQDFCVRFNDYSVNHTFIVERQFYGAGGDINLIRVEIPFSFILRPPAALWGQGAFGDAFLQECVDGETFVANETCLERGYCVIWWAWASYRLVFCSLMYVLPIVVLYVYLKLLKLVWMFVLTGSFRPPMIQTLHDVPMGPDDVGRPDAAYSVFLSHHNHDEEDARAVRVILEAQSLRVFDSVRDVSPDETQLTAWDRAIDDSASFVVLVSKHYRSDPELQAQFGYIRYRMLFHEVSENKVLLISRCLKHIPRNLGPLPVINLRVVNFRQQIEWWAQTEAIGPNHESVARQLTRNIQTSARHLVPIRLQTATALHDIGNMEAEEEDDVMPLGGYSYNVRDHTLVGYDVLLTYCEYSTSDCDVACKVKAHLTMLGLSVFDAVHDIPGGQEETAVVAAAAQCASFVVLLSPAYRTHPLNRRLHFPQVLVAVNTGRISLDNVLIIRTGYTSSGVLPGGREGQGTDPARGLNGEEEESMSEDNYSLPEGLQGLHNFSWTGGLADEDYLRNVSRWARPIVEQRRTQTGET